MRYSILGFNQERVLALTAIEQNERGDDVVLSLDVCDLLILNLISDFPNRIKVKKIIKDDKIFFWASYDEILKELPVLNIKKQALTKRFDKMEKLHVIEREYLTMAKRNNLTFFSLTKTYESLLYDQSDPIVSEYERVSYSDTRGCHTQIRDNNNNIYDSKTDNNSESDKRSGRATSKQFKTIEERQHDFGLSLTQYMSENGGKYPKEMIRAFYDYWTEPNHSNTKMKWELQKTWSTAGRLATWASRDRNFSSNNNYKTRDEQRANELQRRQADAAGIIARLAAEENSDSQ